MLDLDAEHVLASESNACPPDIAKYRVRHGVGSPLAQVELHLDHSNAHKGKEKSDSVARSRAEQIRATEWKLKELKKGIDQGNEPSPQPKVRGGTFFTRFRS